MKNFVRQTINLKYAEKDEDMKGLMSHPKSAAAHADGMGTRKEQKNYQCKGWKLLIFFNFLILTN